MICVVTRELFLIVFVRGSLPSDECCSLVLDLVSQMSKMPVVCLMTMRRVGHRMTET